MSEPGPDNCRHDALGVGRKRLSGKADRTLELRHGPGLGLSLARPHVPCASRIHENVLSDSRSGAHAGATMATPAASTSRVTAMQRGSQRAEQGVQPQPQRAQATG